MATAGKCSYVTTFINIVVTKTPKATCRVFAQQEKLCCNKENAEYSKEQLKECRNISQLCRDIISEECRKSML